MPGKWIKETLPSWSSFVMAKFPRYRDGAPVAVAIVAIPLRSECKNGQRLVVGQLPSRRRKRPTRIRVPAGSQASVATVTGTKVPLRLEVFRADRLPLAFKGVRIVVVARLDPQKD